MFDIENFECGNIVFVYLILFTSFPASSLATLWFNFYTPTPHSACKFLPDLLPSPVSSCAVPSAWNVSPLILLTSTPTFLLHLPNSWPLSQWSPSAAFLAHHFPHPWMDAKPLCIPDSLHMSLSAHLPPSFTISLWSCLHNRLSSVRAGNASFTWWLATPVLT